MLKLTSDFSQKNFQLVCARGQPLPETGSTIKFRYGTQLFLEIAMKSSTYTLSHDSAAEEKSRIIVRLAAELVNLGTCSAHLEYAFCTPFLKWQVPVWGFTTPVLV